MSEKKIYRTNTLGGISETAEFITEKEAKEARRESETALAEMDAWLELHGPLVFVRGYRSSTGAGRIRTTPARLNAMSLDPGSARPLDARWFTDPE